MSSIGANIKNLREQHGMSQYELAASKHHGVDAKLGYEGLTLHQIRHSNLSMMARHMSPFDLKTYAGWSSIEPAKIYIHDDMAQVARAVREAWR